MKLPHDCPPGHTAESRSVPVCPAVLGYEPRAADLVAALDEALHGVVTARPVPPAEVWEELLAEVRDRARHTPCRKAPGGWLWAGDLDPSNTPGGR